MKRIYHFCINRICILLSFLVSIRLRKALQNTHSNIVWKAYKRKLSQVGTGGMTELPLTILGEKNIVIGDSFSARKNLRMEVYEGYLDHKPFIKIGNDVCINFNVHIGAINGIEIGDNVLIGSNVLITDHDHGNTDFETLQIPPLKRPLVSKGKVNIKKNTWIGENVVILAGVTIGENSVIGANTVVTKDIPPNTVVIGNSIKVLNRS